MTIEAKLFYQDKGDNEDVWHFIANSTEERPLKCKKDKVSFRFQYTNYFCCSERYHTVYFFYFSIGNRW